MIFVLVGFLLVSNFAFDAQPEHDEITNTNFGSEKYAFDATPVENGKYKITYTIKYFDKDEDNNFDYNDDVIYKEVEYAWTENDSECNDSFMNDHWITNWENLIPGMGNKNPLNK